jgi:hypothetical protein
MAWRSSIYAATDPTRPREVFDLMPLRLVDPGEVA